MPKLDNYHQFEGFHWETGSVRNYYDYRGVKAPHTNRPYSEAMLMGISGGAVMGCVNYSYSGGIYPQYACDSDGQRSAQGHLAQYAGEYCQGARLDGTWAWSDGQTCSLRGQNYIWGIAVR